MFLRDLNCSEGLEESLDPNPDISGIGVLVGFVGTAHLSILITIGYYVLALNPDEDPHVAANGGTEAWGGNPVDRYFVGLLRRGFVKSFLQGFTQADVAQTLEKAFNRCFLQLCDIQLITGIAILVAAYCSLGSGLSAYHWQTAVYLAWFANLTHLSCLTFLRKYLYINRRQRNWRVAFMGILFIMLIVSELPTIFFNWPKAGESLSLAKQGNVTGTSPGVLQQSKGTLEVTAANASSSAGCYFDIGYANLHYQAEAERYRVLLDMDTTMPNGTTELLVFGDIASLGASTAFQSTIFSILLLVFNFITRSIKLSRTLSSWVRGRVRPCVGRLAHGIVASGHKKFSEIVEKRKQLAMQQPNAKGRKSLDLALSYLYTKPMVALVLLARLYMDYYSSMASEVYWLIVSSAWGSLTLQKLRNSVEITEEDIMTFGQVLSIFFLAGPLLAVAVSLWPAFSKVPRTHQEKQDHPATERNSIWEGPPVSPTDDLESGRPQPSPARPTIQQLLQHNYYSQPWASPMIVLAGLQIIFFTVYLLSATSHFKISALKVFADYLLWFLVIQPWACYYMILFGLVYSERPGKLDLVCYWGMCGLLFFATAVFPFSWRMKHGYVFGSSGYLGQSLVYAALVVPGFIVTYVIIVLCYIWRVSHGSSRTETVNGTAPSGGMTA
ncbi:hypothetical protein V8F20_001330 [Naviculisporaceae sp. PSN 640]